jgi:NADH dehydrogenase
MSYQHILITGASGFIGSEVCRLMKTADLTFSFIRRKDTSHSSAHTIGHPLLVDWPHEIASIDFKNFTCIVHLGYAPIVQSISDQEVKDKHISPFRLLVQQVMLSNPDCHFLFISSQSALPHSESRYGQIKFALEQVLKESSLSWTIVRPGFVFGESSKGLFGKILKFIRRFPIVPLIGDSNNLIQPVYVHDIAKALVEIAKNPANHIRREYFLASQAISFHKFLKFVAQYCRTRGCIYFPLPKSICSTALFFFEKVLAKPPFTRSNLLGFLDLRVSDSDASWAALKLAPTPLEEALSDMRSNYNEGNQIQDEARYLFSFLFKSEAPKTLLQCYQDAHITFPESKYNLVVNMQYIVKHKIDVEALECVLRKKSQILTQKLLLVIYLAEMEFTLSSNFENSQKNKIMLAYFILAVQVIRSVYKKCKGRFVLWMHPSCMTQSL